MVGMEQTESVALSIIFILTTILGMVYIIRKAILKFMVILHITCLFGTFIILTAAIFDLLRKLTIMEYSNYTSLYFLCTTLTSILSCYVILQVGMNFYQDYTFMRTSLMFAPVMVSMGTFVLATFTAIRKSLDQSIKETTSTREFEMITFYLSLAVGVLSLIYCVYPLFTIKSQVRLEPQQTAVSFVHFFIVVILFTAHFVVYALVTLKGYPVFERDFNIMDEFLLLLIFPGCLFTPPRGIVKLVKRRLLGVEQLTIGGDYRPDTLANGYNSRAPVLSTISPPMAPSSRSIQTPLQNSTSPRRSESPLIRDSFYPKTSLSMPVRVNSIESDTSFYLNRFFGRSNDPPNQKTNPLQNRTDPPREP